MSIYPHRPYSCHCTEWWETRTLPSRIRNEARTVPWVTVLSGAIGHGKEIQGTHMTKKQNCTCFQITWFSTWRIPMNLQKTPSFKLWCWRRLLRDPWTARRSNQSIIKEVSPEYSLERMTDGEAEAPVLWPPDVKSRLVGKDPDAGKDWGQEEKGVTEDEMVGWTQWTWVWASSGR